MKVVLDACVLYPTVLREIVMGVAGRGLFTPLWSARILEEWARATDKLGPGAEELARGEIALLRARWPGAEVGDSAVPAVDLPDPNDLHVLSAAIAGQADAIVTLNLRDFPRKTLDPLGLSAIHPDSFLLGLWQDQPQAVAEVAEAVRQEAERLSGTSQPLRALLKRARLPRLGKTLES